MLLAGKKGLVLNIMNKNSIGWAIAQAAAGRLLRPPPITERRSASAPRMTACSKGFRS